MELFAYKMTSHKDVKMRREGTKKRVTAVTQPLLTLNLIL